VFLILTSVLVIANSFMSSELLLDVGGFTAGLAAAIAQLESRSLSSSFSAHDQAELLQLRAAKRALTASSSPLSPTPKRVRTSQSPAWHLSQTPEPLVPSSVAASNFVSQLQSAGSAGGLTPCATAQGFAALASTSEISAAELCAIQSVCDRPAYDSLRQSTPLGPIQLVECSRGSLFEFEGSSVLEGCTVNVGQVFAFPMSPLFTWTSTGPYAFPHSNWHMYELVEAIPNPVPDSAPAESFLLASCSTMFPVRPGIDVCFAQSGSHRVLLQNLPQCMVSTVNSGVFRRRRLEMEDRDLSLSARSTPRSSRLSRSRLLDSRYVP
jgi:hypothetical protein